MTKIQVDSNGKAIMLGGKALAASEGGVTPTGTLSITANGTYDVTNYASADVNVSGGGGNDILFYAWVNGNTTYYTTTDIIATNVRFYARTRTIAQVKSKTQTGYGDIIELGNNVLALDYNGYLYERNTGQDVKR